MASNTEKRITAKMVLDSTGYNDKLKGLNAEMKKHQAELKLASQGIKSFGADSEKLKSVQESLSKQVELHSKKVDIYKQSMEKATSKMQDNIKERDRLKSSLDAANKKYDEAVKLYGKESTEAKKAKEDVDKLTEEHKKASKAVETNAKQVQNYETNMNKANTQMVKAQGELKKVNNELDKNNNKWLKASEGLKKSSERLKNVGGKVTDIGTKVTALSTPIAAVGIASSKLGMDFEASMSNVSALSGSTGKDLKELEIKARDMGAKTSKSAKDAADAMGYMSLAGWKQQQIIGGIEPVLRLAEAGNLDLARASALTTDSLSAMGLTVKDLPHYLDVVAQTARNSNTDIDQMAEAYIKVGGTLNGLNIPLEESATILGILANKGIKGAESGTALNAVVNNLTAPTGRAEKALDKLKLTAFDSKGKFKGLTNVLQELKDKTKDMTEADRNMYLSMIGGKEHVKDLNALLNGLGDEYDGLNKNVKNADGALNEMATTMQNNNKGSITQLKSATEELGLKIYDVLKPSIASIIDKLQQWTDKLNAMSPEQQKMIVKMGALAVATGPAIVGIGKLTTGLGNIIGFAGKTAGAIGRLTLATKGVSAATKGASVATGVATKGISAMGLATKAGALLLNPWVLGIAAASAGVYALHKHMSKECVPSVDLFNSKVETTTQTTDEYGNKIEIASTKTVKFADSTKKAVGGFIKLNDGAKKNLTDLYVNSTKITEKTAGELIAKFKEMGEQIKKGEDKKYEERLKSFKKFLDKNKTMSDKEKKDALKKMEDSHKNQKKETDKYVKQIQDILKKASDKKRALTKEEQAKINEIQEKMKKEGIKKLSETEEESKVILGRIKEYGTRITAEQASEVIKNAEKQRQESVKKAEEQHKQTVAQIEKMRDEDKTITKEQADQMISEAERQKNESITKAGDLKDGVVNKIKSMNSDIIKDIDTSDGHIKSKWERLSDWFSNNPIIRWIKTMTQDESNNDNVGHNWTGSNYWTGGLTYLHDSPGRNTNYELYDLPRGTRIFNHDASQDLVMKTAESVATKVANSVLSGFNGTNGINVTQNIYSPTPSASEIARQTKNNLRELALNF